MRIPVLREMSWRRRRSLGASILVTGASVLVACDAARQARDTTLDFVVGFVPRSVDLHIGRMASEPVYPKSQQIPANLHKSLERFVAPIVAAVPSVAPGHQVNFRFHLVGGDAPNAFAFPDGSIFFTTALFRLAETPEEVLSVAGHEIAHVLARHGMQGMVTHLSLNMALQLLLGDLGAIAGVASLGGQFMALQFSRDNEREADALGADILRRAGMPVSGTFGFFQRLAAWETRAQQGRQPGSGTSPALNFLSTHPATSERLAWARDLRDSAGARVLPSQFQDFRFIRAAAQGVDEKK